MKKLLETIILGSSLVFSGCSLSENSLFGDILTQNAKLKESRTNIFVEQEEYNLSEKDLIKEYEKVKKENMLWHRLTAEELSEKYEVLKKKGKIKEFEERVREDCRKFWKEFFIDRDVRSIESVLNGYLIIKDYKEAEGCMIKWINRKENSEFMVERIMSYYASLKAKGINLERFEEKAKEEARIYRMICPVDVDGVRASWIICSYLKDKKGMKETIEAGYDWDYNKKILKEWEKEIGYKKEANK